MKKFFKIILAIVLIMVSFYSCSDDVLVSVATAPVDGQFLITPSTDNIVLNKVDADNQTAITFNWEKTWYGIDTPTKFTIQMDVSDGDFSKPITTELIANQKSYTHTELNTIALKLKLKPDVAGKIKVRLKTALNYGALPVYSNTVIITVTPYNVLILKYPMPTALYLQGDAVPSNWGTPVPDIQKMVQIDNHRFGLLVALTAGKSFAFLITPTAWSTPAYLAATGTEPSIGGNFIINGPPNWAGSSIKTPAGTGVYQVIIDFTTGTYSVTPAQVITAPPTDLYLIGDAAPLGWATGPSQKFTKIDTYSFTITIPLIGGKSYDFITANAAWSDPAYRAKTASEPLMGGNFMASGSATVPTWGGSDIKAPDSGTYKITVNFKSGTYVLE